VKFLFSVHRASEVSVEAADETEAIAKLQNMTPGELAEHEHRQTAFLCYQIAEAAIGE
jgi:hypothetical protein